MSLTILKIGKADSILISYADHHVLIDNPHPYTRDFSRELG